MIAFDLTPAQRFVAEWRTVKSICTCSHTGDGTGSDHHDLVLAGDGHGACKHTDCSCSQFDWRRWTATFGEALAKLLHTNRKAVCRGH